MRTYICGNQRQRFVLTFSTRAVVSDQPETAFDGKQRLKIYISKNYFMAGFSFQECSYVELFFEMDRVQYSVNK